MISGLIPILLLSIAIAILLSLAIALYVYTDRNKLQRTLIAILCLWAIMFIGLLAALLSVYNGSQSPVSGILNFRAICTGLFGLFSLISYPAVVLHQHMFSVRGTLLKLFPLLLIFLIYIGWHIVTGVSMNHQYTTLDMLWEKRHTAPVILRMLMIFSFVAYLMLTLQNIWELIPVYEKYSKDNYSDPAHNVGWLRLVVVAIAAICSAHLLLIFWRCHFAEIIYAIITVGFFALLSINAFSHKLFNESDNVEFSWSFQKGWQLLAKEQVAMTEADFSRLATSLDVWMKETKPFVNPDFSTSDVYRHFPELQYPILKEILDRRGQTFQSYVRLCRIAEACDMIRENPRIISKEIAFRVGLSSSWVLSRSFVAVTGQTPMEYRRNDSSLQA